MTLVLVASSQLQVLLLAAALDAGLLGHGRRRRILVLADTSPVPEIGPGLAAAPALAAVADRFDAIVSYNDLVAPHRPGGFSPRAADAPVWERLVRAAWQIPDGPVEIVVESVHVDPARALATVFPNATISVHADGLMVYGPTRKALPGDLARRLGVLVHPDLFVGLRPQLLREHDIRTVAIPLGRIADLVSDVSRRTDPALGLDGTAAPSPLARPAPAAPASPHALVLSQYLADLGILTRQEEDELHTSMLDEVVRAGIGRVVVKPHPRATAPTVRAFRRAAEHRGLVCDVAPADVLAEVLVVRGQPAMVVGGFSTALVTASALGVADVRAVGTGLVMERLVPFQNSNRVPLVIVDRVFGTELPDVAEPTVDELGRLLEAVAHCMQPTLLPELRSAAARFVDADGPVPWTRYVRRLRAERLGLVTVPTTGPVTGPVTAPTTTHGTTPGPAQGPGPARGPGPAHAPVPGRAQHPTTQASAPRDPGLAPPTARRSVGSRLLDRMRRP